MAIEEVENVRREKSGEEKFEIVVSSERKNALGDQMITILHAAYKQATRFSDPCIKIPPGDSITRTALWILTDLTHLIAPINQQHRIEHRGFIITQQGMATVEHFFPLD